MAKKSEPTFTDYNKFIVPIAPLRVGLAQLQKDGFDAMPLGELLLIIARIMKDDKEKE